jgi:hypothetical protein
MAKKTATTEQPADTREQGAPETPEQQAIKREAQRLADQTRAFIAKAQTKGPAILVQAIALTWRQQGTLNASLTSEDETVPTGPVLAAYYDLLIPDLLQCLSPLLAIGYKAGQEQGRQQGAKDTQALTDAVLLSINTSAQYQAGYRAGRADARKEQRAIVQDTVTHTLDQIKTRARASAKHAERAKTAGAASGDTQQREQNIPA